MQITTSSTVKHGKLIVERFIRLKQLLSQKVDNDNLKCFKHSFLNCKSDVDGTMYTTVSDEVIDFVLENLECGSVESWMGRLKHKCGILLSRELVTFETTE